jgi:hypothetical protein
MALFSLTDIKINNKQRVGGSADKLVGSQYNYNTFRYPLDLGNYDKGHYMVIHINEQRETQFKGKTTSDIPTVINNKNSQTAIRGSTNLGGNIKTVSEVSSDAWKRIAENDTIKSIGGSISDGVSSVKNIFGQSQAGSTLSSILGGASEGASESIQSAISGITSGSFTRTIRRTTDTIALYMPDTLVFQYNQQYSTPSLSGALTGALAAGTAAAETYKNMSASGKSGEEISKEMTKNLAPFAFAALAKTQGDLGNVLFAAGTGLAMNPMMEMIYSSPQFRQFRFDFVFYPRDEREALEVQNILERLRFHQAPEIKSNTGGFFLVPPSEFDIKFYYNGYENPNIPRISTCVLKGIDINYAPNGWSAYETLDGKPELGKTGMPVGITLSLDFEETEILTKDSFTRTFGSQRG